VTSRGARWFASTVWWTFANAVSPGFGAVVIGLVLARRISPAEFAAYAVAVVALLGMQSLQQLGVGRAAAAWRGDPYEAAPTVTAISVASGAAVCIGGYLAAPIYADALGEQAATSMIRWLALSVLIGSVGAGPASVLARRSPRATKVFAEGVDNWVAVAVAVGLAARGHPMASLAAGRIAGSAAGVLLSAMFAPRGLRIGWRPGIAKALLGAGLPFGLYGLLRFLATNADLIIIGRLLPSRSLGLYFLALCLATWPVTLCSQPVRDHAPATFARFRRGPQVAASAFQSAVYLVSCLTVPICILLITSGQSIVALLYGPGWATAAAALAWLAPVAALRVCLDLSFSYLAEQSRRAALTYQLVFLCALIPALVAGVRSDGIVGAAIVQVALAAPTLLVRHLPVPRRNSMHSAASLARLAFRLLVLLAIGWVAFNIRRSSDPEGRLILAVGSAVALGISAVLVRVNRGVLHTLIRANAKRRWPLMPDGVVPMPSAAETMRFQVLTLVPPPPMPQLPQPAAQSRPGRHRAGAAGSDQGSSEEQDLGHKVRSGAMWSTLNTLVLRIANFGTTVLLARTVFGPQAFGLYAVSQVILALLLSANEMGVSLAIVRWDTDVRQFARTVYTLAVASSTLLYLMLYAAAPELARVLGSPGATDMVRVLCLTVIIDGLVCVQLALLTRVFAQRRLMLVNALNFATSTGVTLWLAFSGHGPMSFAWGSVAGCLVAWVAASIAAPFFVWPGWNTSQARGLLRFGLPLAGASLLLLGVYNVDSAIVGALLGPGALGLYALAFNVSSWPVRAISEAARRVSFAGFSRVANDAHALGDAYARAVGLVMAAAVPACVVLGTLAEPLIRTVYGQRWIAAAPVLTLLAVLGLLRVVYELSYDCLAAAGGRSKLLGVQGWWLATLIPVLLLGARLRGIVGVGAGHVVVAGILVSPAFAWALSSCGIRLRTVLAACIRPLLGGILMTAFCELALYAIGDGLAGMAIAVLAGCAVYLPVVFPMVALVRGPTQTPEMLEQEHAA
jgi:O-antigen/teichoic acid export membrane protein